MAAQSEEQKLVCFACISESYLSHEIQTEGSMGLCAYCGQTRACIYVEELADRIQTAFENHYVRTSNQPDAWQQSLQADRESDYEWWRDGSPVLDAIQEAAGVSDTVAEDVLEILDDRHSDFDSAAMGEETEFSPDSHYEWTNANARTWHEAWRNFEESLRVEARFFSRIADDLLSKIFGNIDKLKAKPRHPLVVKAGVNSRLTHLYRARVFQSETALKEALCHPDLHLGSPPARHASAGRMNAHGISVFYGATNPAVALAEVRPPVGSEVLVAKFDIIRPLHLLDLTALDNARDDGSIFDPSFKGRLERVAFLRSLGQSMTLPVMPDDQAFDYLATQAVADFLATQNEPRLDGIIFPSAQSKQGHNVVLFHKAASVEQLSFPRGTEIEAHTGYGSENGWEIDYGVSETVPKEPDEAPVQQEDEFSTFILSGGLFSQEDRGIRKVALRIDVSSIEVHHVDWVKINSTKFSVSRRRHERQDWKF